MTFLLYPKVASGISFGPVSSNSVPMDEDESNLIIDPIDNKS